MKGKAVFGAITVALLLWGSTASAAVILQDSFSYANQAALDAAWPSTAGTTKPYVMDTAIGNPAGSVKLAQPSTSSGVQRYYKNLGAAYNGTDAQPLVVTFDFKLSATTSSGREWVELRGYAGNAYNSGALQNLLAIGVMNNSNDGAYSSSKYQARMAYGSTGNNWVTLTTQASRDATAWHSMKIVVMGTKFQFAVDNGTPKEYTRTTSYSFDDIVLGSGNTSAGVDAWVDNIKVETVPEPATIVALTLGSVWMLRRRRV